jgi:hypothetical protein
MTSGERCDERTAATVKLVPKSTANVHGAVLEPTMPDAISADPTSTLRSNSSRVSSGSCVLGKSSSSVTLVPTTLNGDWFGQI